MLLSLNPLVLVVLVGIIAYIMHQTGNSMGLPCHALQYFVRQDFRRSHSMRRCGGFILSILDAGNRRKSQKKSLRGFGGGGG